MRAPRPRIAVAALLAVALLAVTAALPCAPCCAPPSDARVLAPTCCGCAAALARPAAADRTAGETRRARLPATLGRPVAVVVAASAMQIGRLAPLPLAPFDPPAPFPRRL